MIFCSFLKICNLLHICMSSLSRGHIDLCIVAILVCVLSKKQCDTSIHVAPEMNTIVKLINISPHIVIIYLFIYSLSYLSVYCKNIKMYSFNLRSTFNSAQISFHVLHKEVVTRKTFISFFVSREYYYRLNSSA